MGLVMGSFGVGVGQLFKYVGIKRYYINKNEQKILKAVFRILGTKWLSAILPKESCTRRKER